MSRKLVVFLVFVIVLFAGATGYFFYQVEKQKVALQSDIQVQKLREQIDLMKQEALALALTISKNPVIVKSLKEKKPENLAKDMDSLLKSYSDSNGEIYRIQLHTPQQTLFFRSWEHGVFGEDLRHRKGIAKVIEFKKPIVSIELGKELNIKAIVPVFGDKKYLGSLEVIKSFDKMVERFKSSGTSLVILLDELYKKQAVGLRQNSVTNGFIVVNKDYDKYMVEDFEKINFYLFLNNVSVKSRNYFLSAEPLIDIDGRRIGFFIVGVRKDKVADGDIGSFYLTMPKDDIALLNKPRLEHENVDIRAIVEGYPNMNSEDKAFYYEKLLELLKDKKTEQVADAVLGKNPEPIRGEIR